MRKMLKALSLPICAMLLFSACASSLNLRPGPFRSEMQDVFVQQTTLAVPASHAEHGEDYVIEWQDPVMEKHVRKWLDRPKGDLSQRCLGLSARHDKFRNRRERSPRQRCTGRGRYWGNR